jgi:hypothetical protein
MRLVAELIKGGLNVKLKAFFLIVCSTNFSCVFFLVVEQLFRPTTIEYYGDWRDIALFFTISFIVTWFIMMPTAMLFGLISEDKRGRHHILDDRGPRGPIYCRKCRYQLNGLELHRCPECGQPFDPEDLKTISTNLKGKRDVTVYLGYSWVICSMVLVFLYLMQLVRAVLP